MLDTASQSAFQVKPELISVELQHEIEQFYYWEAKLMADRRWEEWFSLMSKDIKYWAPLRSTRVMREAKLEYTDEKGFGHFADNWSSLDGRIRKITSDVGWSENPASRLRHIVGNVLIWKDRQADVYDVSTSLMTDRNRQERQTDFFAAERQDRIRRVDDACGFEIVERKILIDQSTLLSNNISFFF
ncbi:MAG: aromatic-ring-hydroxylating dioxygenase subunit beta [Candidatus Hydrogenedentales bacterium]|jgi:3-phenylpropionate/cinnamic acid dioxygenase small subunit